MAVTLTPETVRRMGRGQASSCEGPPALALLVWAGWKWLSCRLHLYPPQTKMPRGKSRKRTGDLHLRTPIFGPVSWLCSPFMTVPYFLHPRGCGLWKAGPWEGLSYHFRVLCSVPVGPGAQQKTR